MDEIEKRKAGRPFKMNNWLPQLKIVLKNEDWIFLTDEDLVFLVNSKLPENEQISQSAYKQWKSGKFAPDNETGKEFINCIKLALIKQKQMLGKRLFEDPANAFSIRWILERKWSELNLKSISENINKNEQATVIQITAGNDEQKKLIESIMNAEFTEIQPLQLNKKTDVDDSTDNENEDEIGF